MGMLEVGLVDVLRNKVTNARQNYNAIKFFFKTISKSSIILCHYGHAIYD